MKNIALAILSLLIASCGQDLTSPRPRGSRGQDYSAITCACSETVKPVCGTKGNIQVTIINACIAQCNNYEYTTGPCPIDNSQACDSNSGQKCGIPPCPTGVNCEGPRLYTDECSLRNAQASVVDLSQCSSSL